MECMDLVEASPYTLYVLFYLQFKVLTYFKKNNN